MKRLLPFMFIADAEHDPFRVRYRLVGMKAVEITCTGHYLDELLRAEPDQPWIDHYRPRLSHSCPSAWCDPRPDRRRLFTYEFGVFPLRNGGTAIEQVVAVEDYFGLSAKIVLAEPWREKPPVTQA